MKGKGNELFMVEWRSIHEEKMMELDKKESLFSQESFNLERGKLREKGRNRVDKNQSGKTKSKFHKFCLCYTRGQKMKFLFFLMSLNFMHGSTSSWINCCMVLISQNIELAKMFIWGFCKMLRKPQLNFLVNPILSVLFVILS